MYDKKEVYMKRKVFFLFEKSRKIKAAATFLIFATILPVFSAPRGAQELVPAGSWIYDALTAVALESGIVQFTDCAPLTISEIKSYLYEIDYDSLSKGGKAQYDRINDYFNQSSKSLDSDFLSVGFSPSLNPESYWKSNDDIAWVYDRYERKPVIDLPLTISGRDYFTMYTDLYLGQNQCKMAHDDTYVNLPFAPDDIDINFPHVGYGSTGLKFTDTCGLSFQLGMGPVSVGRTQTGSIIMSEYMTQASYGQLSLYSTNFRYSMLVSQLNVDKYMYTHRLDFRFFKKLTFSVLESTLTNAEMELRYLNPLTVYHGAAPWRDYTATDEDDSDSHNGEFLGISIQYIPVKNVRLYALYAMNQFQTPYENSNFDSKTPNSLGGQAGLEAYIPAKDGYFHFAAEGYYANPYLYIKQSPDWSFCRTYEENIGDKDPFYEWMGSPFGPDSIAFNLELGYEKPGKWAVDFKYLYLCQGELSGTNAFKNLEGWGGTDVYAEMDDGVAKNWPYPSQTNGLNQFAITPTGTPQYTNKLSIKGTWYASKTLSFTAQPSYVIILNNNNQSGKTEWGIETAFAISWRLYE